MHGLGGKIELITSYFTQRSQIENRGLTNYVYTVGYPEDRSLDLIFSIFINDIPDTAV